MKTEQQCYVKLKQVERAIQKYEREQGRGYGKYYLDTMYQMQYCLKWVLDFEV